MFSSPFDGNLVYQFHYYCWDHPSVLKSVQEYLNDRKRFNAPVWVGETGEADDSIYWATTEYFEANNIGWSFWPWKKMDAANGPYSINTPAGWKAVQNYTEGGEKPSTEAAQKTFDELLQNIRLENCAYRPGVVNAMFRRIPGKVDAKNYGREGVNQSYHVKDAGKNAEYYRTSEPVPISLADQNQEDSEQVVTLGAGEWTAYTVDCATAGGNYEANCPRESGEKHSRRGAVDDRRFTMRRKPLHQRMERIQPRHASAGGRAASAKMAGASRNRSGRLV